MGFSQRADGKWQAYVGWRPRIQLGTYLTPEEARAAIERYQTKGEVSVRCKRHGHSKSREYAIWEGMKRRCLVPHDKAYPYYGGRGIKLDVRWHQFGAFLADMGPCPPNYSIDRIDNEGNYEPGNCRWASQKEQARNTRRNRLVTYMGRTEPLIWWAEQLGVDAAFIRARLNRGFSVGQALWPFDRKNRVWNSAEKTIWR